MRVVVGIDLVSPSEVAESIERFGEHYLGRVYSARELNECSGEPRRLASCFAVKEATFKVLAGAAEQTDVAWHEISWTPREGVRLSGAAAAAARRGGVDDLSASVGSSSGLVSAVVLGRLHP